MTGPIPRPPAVTPRLLIQAYIRGIFPMAESRDDPEIFWVEPRMRGVIPLGGLHVSRSLARRMRAPGLHATLDRDFDAVLAGCADREETWINDTIFGLYASLHRTGHAHSVEVRRDGALIGGVYGVAIGGAFFGESMFSASRDGSKLALVFLVDLLRRSGFVLFDTQFLTPHLASMGGVEIPRWEYRARLAEALRAGAVLIGDPALPDAAQVLQRMTQRS